MIRNRTQVEDQSPKSHFFRVIVQNIVLFWQVYPLATLGTVGLTIVQGLLPLASAWILKTFIDWIAQHVSGDAEQSMQFLIMLLIAQALVIFASAMFPSLNRYLQAELGRRLELRLQTNVYEKITGFKGLAPFEHPPTYDTMRLAQAGAEHSIRETLPSLMGLVENLVTLLSFLIVFVSLDASLAILGIVASIPDLVAQTLLTRRRVALVAITSADERRKGLYSSILADAVAAKEVQLFGIGGYFLNKLTTASRRIHGHERNLDKQELGWGTGLGFLSSVFTGGAWILIAISAFNGRMSLGDVTLAINGLVSLQGSLQRLISTIGSLFGSVLFYRYYEILLQMPPALSVTATPRPVPILTCGLEFRGVSFRYRDDLPWILRDINLTIPAGQCIALVGVNGAGKTTLVKLLMRMYDPTEGQILWDGIDIREFDIDEFRTRIGAVFQDFMRYDLTAQENIGLGDITNLNNASLIEEAARHASVHDVITDLPQGYQTELTRMFAEESLGYDLSGGQWQRIATARMFMRQASVLILDEPTSALDAEAEYETNMQFRTLLAERTGVLIAHRFNTVRMAHLIAVLDNGQITEYGTHETLMKHNGTYAHLYYLQASGYHETRRKSHCEDSMVR